MWLRHNLGFLHGSLLYNDLFIITLEIRGYNVEHHTLLLSQNSTFSITFHVPLKISIGIPVHERTFSLLLIVSSF